MSETESVHSDVREAGETTGVSPRVERNKTRNSGNRKKYKELQREIDLVGLVENKQHKPQHLGALVGHLSAYGKERNGTEQD